LVDNDIALYMSRQKNISNGIEAGYYVTVCLYPKKPSRGKPSPGKPFVYNRLFYIFRLLKLQGGPENTTGDNRFLCCQ